MTTHSSKTIDKFVELEARKYAEFVGGVIEEIIFGGYCVSSEGEFVLFDKEYIGREVEYIPCRCYYDKYAVKAHIHANNEAVDIII